MSRGVPVCHPIAHCGHGSVNRPRYRFVGTTAHVVADLRETAHRPVMTNVIDIEAARDAGGWKHLSLALLGEQARTGDATETARLFVYEEAARLAGMSLRMAELLPDLLTPDEVCTYLSVSKNTLYSWRRDGYGPPAIHVGKHLRFPKSSLVAWSIAQAA